MFKAKIFDKLSSKTDSFTDYLEESVNDGGSYSKDSREKNIVMDYPKGSTEFSCDNVDDKSGISHDHDDFIMSFYENDQSNNE